MSDQTVRHGMSGMPIRTLRVDLVDGPDAGASRISEGETLTIGTAEGNDLVLTDATVSRYHADFSRHTEGILVVDHDSTNGTLSGSVRIERAIVPPGTVLRLGRTSLRVADGGAKDVDLHDGNALGGLRGASALMRHLMARVERLAPTPAAVLLVGESGTGKELIARALHDLGPRARAPFITVDCGAIPPTLLASELFGHERGAFTGADRRHVGAFERADGGTIFLDEIGELPAEVQSALLGVLERQRFQRVGGREPLSVDVRVVSATHRDLRAEVNQGRFRLDLYYRVAVVVLRVPALRDRREDVPLLVEHFLRARGFSGNVDSVVSPTVMELLLAHRWPGNVRELRNVVEATLAMGEPPALEGASGPDPAAATADPVAPLLGLSYRLARGSALQHFESQYLRALLHKSGGNVSRAAREAQMDRSHLVDLLRRHGLK